MKQTLYAGHVVDNADFRDDYTCEYNTNTKKNAKHLRKYELDIRTTQLQSCHRMRLEGTV